ncbi:MAG TPA: metallopeptidase TldD-related protein [Bryobacteraceae bacterium]|nr:metallopeptidase TldD-related protein [Bryobacteraceae bacterium]
MRIERVVFALALLQGGLLPAQSAKIDEDPVLKAMLDELDHSRALRVVDLDRPYYFEYSLEDLYGFNASATFGGLISENHIRARFPRVQVRVGSYEFDNTNHVQSGRYSGARYDSDQWPIDNNYAALRQNLWLATDRAFKTAVEAIARKRASLRNAAPADTLADFSAVEPVRSIQDVAIRPFPWEPWLARLRKLSAEFTAYPEVALAFVDLEANQGIARFVNSEGTVERYVDTLLAVRIRAQAQAPDGSPLHEALVIPTMDIAGLPSEAELSRLVREVGDDLRALVKAPVSDAYSGPVLFEARAAAQLFAQTLGDNLRLPRRPVSDGGRPAPFVPSELEAKVGSRILPEWIDVVDDPTQTEWRGRKLLGCYPFDLEGVAPKPVVAVEKGILKTFLTTRQPVSGVTGSNGHARLTGAYGTNTAAIGNLFIKASQTETREALKQQLIDMVKRRNKPYGMLVRKLDYPSAASFREIQSLAASSMQAGSRPISPPLMVYRVYPDGREELVRGLQFRAVSTRSLRDIVAASDENYVFDFINNGAPLAMIGFGGYVAPTSVIAPSVLFEDMELYRPQEEQQRPPLVPAPAMTE